MKLHLPIRLFRAVIAVMALSLQTTLAYEYEEMENLTVSAKSSNNSGGAFSIGSGEELFIHNISDNITGTDDVIIQSNGISGGKTLYGGAIYAATTQSTVNVSNNGYVNFNRNASSTYSSNGISSFSSAYGGAIYSEGAISVYGNEKVTFNKNDVFADSYTDTYNGGATSYAYGGAIYSAGTFKLSDNRVVSFTSNYASSDSYGTNMVYNSGSGRSISLGGAIYSNGALTISNNGDVSFVNNYAYASAAGKASSSAEANAGAIYSTGAISIVGNDSVLFEKNYEYAASKAEAIYRLRSIVAKSTSLTLAAKTGGNITFYDSVWLQSGMGASFNDTYKDKDGIIQKAGGDIIFSGKYASAHIAEIKGEAGTWSEISNSRLSYIECSIRLYGGSLQVIDGAQLNGSGLTVASDSGAKLLLDNGSMNHNGYNFTFNKGTTLELRRANNITATKLIMGGGSTLSISLDSTNLGSAALNLGSTDLETSQLTLNLNRTDGLTSGTYKIISQNSASDFTTSSLWSEANVSFNGQGYANRAIFTDLVWENGTLYYKVGRNIWNNTSGDFLWNTSSDNWEMNGRSYTYLDGMDVYFAGEGTGNVTLQGDVAPASIEVNNNLGSDYILNPAIDGGRIVGSTGILKNGTGALTIATPNTFTGETKLNKGTLNVHHSSALGDTSNGGTAILTTLSGTNLNIDNNSHVILSGINSIAGNVNIAEGSSLEMKNKGYSASNSNVDGRLIFAGANAASTKVYTLTGNGEVEISDSNVTISTLGQYSGSFAVNGNNSKLVIKNGNYNAAGHISIIGEGASLDVGSNSINVRSKGSLHFETSNTATQLTAASVSIASGATISASNKGEQNTTDCYNGNIAGLLKVTSLTLHSGSSYIVDGGHISFNNAEVTLGVTTSAKQKINLILSHEENYAPDERICLFSGVSTLNFLYDNLQASTYIYTLDAEDYFCGDWVNSDTELIFEYDSLYITNVNSSVISYADIVWNNASGDNRWNVSSLNWLSGTSSSQYKDGAAIRFGDDGAGIVTLAGDLAPGSVLVDCSEDYTWNADATAGGKLTGDMSLTKKGTGTLSINTENDYTGGTQILGGKVVAGTSTALGAGMVSLDNSTLQINAAGFGNSVSTAGNSSIIITDNGTLVLSSSCILNTGKLNIEGAVDASNLKLNVSGSTRIDAEGHSGNSGFLKDESYSVQVVSGGTVSGNVTIKHNDLSLTLGSDGYATAGGGINYRTYYLNAGDSVSALAAQKAAGNQLQSIIMSGGTLYADDSIKVQAAGGQIQLISGVLSGELSGATSLSASGVATINSANAHTGGTVFRDADITLSQVTALGKGTVMTTGTNTLNATSGVTLQEVILNSGTLTLSGSWDVSALALNARAATLIDVDGREGDSGFIRAEQFEVQVVLGGTSKGTGLTLHHNLLADELHLQLGENGLATAGGGMNYSTYYLSSGDSVSVGRAEDVSGGLLNNIVMTGGELTVDGPVNLEATGGSITISDDSILTGRIDDAVISTAPGTYDSTISATIGGGSSLSIGGGTITVTGNNTYNGGTTINAGRLEVEHENALGTGAVQLNGGTLDLNSRPVGNDIAAKGGILAGADNYAGKLSISGDVTLDGNTTAGGGIDLNGGNISGGSIVDTDISINGPGNMNIDSDIRGESSLTVNGGSTTLSGNNSYTGGTTINGGNLTIGNGSSMGTGGITMNGGTLDLNDQHIGNDITLNDGNLTGNGNYSGNLSIGGDEVTVEGGYTLSSGKVLTIARGGTEFGSDLTLAGGTLLFEGSPLTVDGEVSFTSGTTTLVDLRKWQQGQLSDGLTLAVFGEQVTGWEEGCLELIGMTDMALNFDSATGSLTLQMVKDEPVIESISWLGASKAVWQEGKAGWMNATTGHDVVFTAGAHVIFTQAGTVTISGAVEPGALIVAGDKAVTFKSDKVNPGRIVGDAGLLKRGKGVLTMNDGNTYSGGTIVENGTLKAGGASSFGTGDISLLGGTLDLAGKAVANDIELNGGAVIKGGAKYTGEFTMTGGELKKGSVINVADSATLAAGTMDGTLSGTGMVQVTGAVTLGNAAKVTTTQGLTVADSGALTAGAKGLALNAKTSTLTIDGGSLASAGKLSGYALSMSDGATLTVSNARPMAVNFKGAASVTEDSELSLYGAFTAAELDLTGSKFMLEMNPDLVDAKNKPKAQNVTINGKGTDSCLDAAEMVVAGKMSVTGNLELKNKSFIRLYDPSGKNAAMPLAVKGNLTLGSGSSLTLSGALSAANLTLDGGSINLTGTKQQTIKVSNQLAINSGTDINFNFTVTAKDANKKAFKILTFKTIGAYVDGDFVAWTDDDKPTSERLVELLGLQDAGCTLTLDVKKKNISLTVNDLVAWEAAMEDGEDDAASEETPTPTALAALPVVPDFSPVADALVQANWGQVEASRAFVNAIGSRSMAVQLGSGERAVWAGAIGASSRHSAAGGHNGADTNVTGGALGVETQLGESSLLGVALGASRTRVSAHNYGTIKQDTTHLGVYGQTGWNKLSADWSAAYGRSDSDIHGSSWKQNHLQLDGRVSYNHALSSSTVLRGFGGMQYYASDSATVDGIKTGSIQNLRAEIGVGASHAIGKLGVYGEVAVHQDLVRHNPTVTTPDARYRGMNPGRTGLNFTVGASYSLSDQWSVNASYTGEVVENANAHSVNVGATYKF